MRVTNRKVYILIIFLELMVSKMQKKEMMDYVVSQLKNPFTIISPQSRNLIKGIESNYILVGDKGLVFLIDQQYPNNSLDKIHDGALNDGKDIAFTFLKDGKTFFRSATSAKRFKKDRNLSLKYYSDNELHKMIMFRPEEEFALSLGKCFGGSWVQYYQPNSNRLQEGIVSYEFEPVIYDYSHIPRNERFGGNSAESQKLRIWNRRTLNPGNIRLKDRFLIRG